MLKKTSAFVLMLCMAASMAMAHPAKKRDKKALEELLHNTCKVYDLMRTEKGFYRDYVGTKDVCDHGSTASIGMGLVSLCIANQMGWAPDAEQKIIQTLNSVLGDENQQGIARTPKGCYIHFFDLETGAAKGDDYSPIDTNIMLGGALFAKRYFHKNETIARLADQLYNEVDESLFVGDVKTGKICLKMNEDGSPLNMYTSPYNEYMMVAYFAKSQESVLDGKAHQNWNGHYGNPSKLPAVDYVTKSGEKIPVNTDLAFMNEFTSNFTFMFNYLFVHSFSNDPVYIQKLKNAAMADRAWWQEHPQRAEKGWKDYEWGTTAGTGLYNRNGKIGQGYMVDKICLAENIGTNKDHNRGLNVAPSALAGYSPAMPQEVETDLLAMLHDQRKIGQMTLPKQEGITTGKEFVLWKYSYADPSWKADRIEGVDFGCMLMGLAALPDLLGHEFFNTYNDFFNPDAPQYHK